MISDDDETQWAGGYGKPPYGTRFQKGMSGNPAGSRKKVKPVEALGDRAMRALRTPVPVRGLDGKKTSTPAIDAAIQRGLMLALKADRPLDVTRYLECLAKLGFNYIHEEGAARIEERARYEEALARSAAMLEMCQYEIGRLNRALAARDPLPPEGSATEV